MSKIISLKDCEMVYGKKMTNKSVIVKCALKKLKKENKYNNTEYESVIDPFEFMLACYESLQEKEKRMNNNNNPTGKNYV